VIYRSDDLERLITFDEICFSSSGGVGEIAGRGVNRFSKFADM